MVSLVLAATTIGAMGAPLARAADVLTQHNDNARTGAVLDERDLNTSSVNVARFGKLWTLYADGQVVAQPLYVSRLAVDTTPRQPEVPLVKGTFNASIVATMHNTVYAYDADHENRGPDGRTIPLWATWLGQPRPGTKAIDMWSTNDPEWGILSTPVVSGDKRTLYVVAWHGDGPGEFRYRLHALDMTSGAPQRPAVVIGTASTDPSQPCRKQSPFNPCLHKQRAALLLDRGLLYVAFGGDGNRGSMFVFDAATLTQRAFWVTTPTGSDGGIWQSGQGPAADGTGHVYLMTGNGSFNAHLGGKDYGNSFVKLKLMGPTVTVEDFFAPCNMKFLNDIDLDLGSAGPLLLPVTPPSIVSGGKEGRLYVVPLSGMGGHVPGQGAECQDPASIQQVLAFPALLHDGKTHYGNIHGSPVFWQGPDAARIYAWGENNALRAYRFAQGKLQDIASPRESAFRPPPGMPGGMLAVSSDGNTAGTGIVWALVPLDGDANEQRGVKGIALALDAQDVSRTLWTSEQFALRDRVGLFAKFTTPTVVNGKLFVATYGDDEGRQRYPQNPETHPTQFPRNYGVAVYGLLGPERMGPIVNQDRDDVTVVRVVTMPLALDRTRCVRVDAATLDCTEALAQTTGRPSLHRVVFGAGADLTGCSLLRVTAVGKDAAIAGAAGVGFWSASVADGNSTPGDSGRFVPTGQLRSTGTVTLRDGSAATLLEFVGVVNCQGIGGEPPGRLFKPYMQFEGAGDGRIFRNWDRASNYLVNTAITQFDRSAEVLRP